MCSYVQVSAYPIARRESSDAAGSLRARPVRLEPRGRAAPALAPGPRERTCLPGAMPTAYRGPVGQPVAGRRSPDGAAAGAARFHQGDGEFLRRQARPPVVAQIVGHRPRVGSAGASAGGEGSESSEEDQARVYESAVLGVGQVNADSRKSQARFVCIACGFAGNADVNAARNIAAGHVVTARGGCRDTEPVNRESQLLVSLTGYKKLESPALGGGGCQAIRSCRRRPMG
jgi:hypothetical protein